MRTDTKKRVKRMMGVNRIPPGVDEIGDEVERLLAHGNFKGPLTPETMAVIAAFGARIVRLEEAAGLRLVEEEKPPEAEATEPGPTAEEQKEKVDGRTLRQALIKQAVDGGLADHKEAKAMTMTQLTDLLSNKPTPVKG